MSLTEKLSQKDEYGELAGNMAGHGLSSRTAAENQFVLEASFCAVSDTILAALNDDINSWLGMAVQDKLLQFASMLQNMRKDLRLGGLVGLYQLLRGDQTDLREDILNVVIEEVFTAVADYEAQEQVFLAAALEVIGVIGPNLRSL